jgi:hypothetical protein
MTTTNPSRRHALAGLLAVAPAVAVANSLGGTPDGDDAELLSLKPEFDDVVSEWVRQMTKDCIDDREWVKLHLATFGLEPDESDELEVDWSDPERAAYGRGVSQLINEFHSGRSEDELELGHWDRLHDKINPLAEKILSYKASTLDGLRLQTRTLIIYDTDIWLSPLEGSEPRMCAFFASLCSVLGIPFPPLPERERRWQA